MPKHDRTPTGLPGTSNPTGPLAITDSPNSKKSRTSKQPSEAEMLKEVWLHMPVIDKLSDQLDKLCTRMNNVEESVQFMNEELQETKKAMNDKASAADVKALSDQVIDLVNRSKRNNVIFHNVPEGAEGATPDCIGLVRSILQENLGIQSKAPIEIERAHRTPMAARHTGPRPRPIHVKFLRYGDRELTLKRASTSKNLEFQKERIFISDDVHRSTRDQHRRLLVKVKEMRAQGKFAFIPWSVPRVIKYKDGGKESAGPLKTIKDWKTN